MTAVGFEPTRIAPPELESGALDHSAKLSWESTASTNAVQRVQTARPLRAPGLPGEQLGKKTFRGQRQLEKKDILIRKKGTTRKKDILTRKKKDLLI